MKSTLAIVAGGFLCTLLFLGSSSYAVSTVTGGSKVALAGEQDVMLPICLKNEVDIRSVLLPLMIRKLGPAYVGMIRLSIGDRMVGQLTEIVYYGYFDTGTLSQSTCKRFSTEQPGTPGGFPGIASLAVIADSTDKVPNQPVSQSPYGVFWTRTTLFNNLPAGWDQTGSFLMELDLLDYEGCFEIDTTCKEPAYHLMLMNAESAFEPVAFAPGTIQVGACTGTVLGTPASVPAAVRGPQAAILTWDAIADAQSYEVQIDETDNTFGNLAVDVFVQGTSYTYTVGDEQTIFWRVRACPPSCDYCFGPWAEPQGYTGVQTIASSGIPESYDLNQNYPNPFNASTVIEFTNKHDGNVTLNVYNIPGQNVVTLVDEFKPTGKYAITWDGRDSRGHAVPSGMYFYRVSTSDFTATKKMTLLK